MIFVFHVLGSGRARVQEENVGIGTADSWATKKKFSGTCWFSSPEDKRSRKAGSWDEEENDKWVPTKGEITIRLHSIKISSVLFFFKFLNVDF